MSGRCTGLRFRRMLSYAEIYAQEWEREFGRAVSMEPVLTHLNTFPLRTQRVRENIKRHREERRRRFWEERAK